MLLKTILNDCCKFKSFVYVQTYFSEDRKSIEVLIKPRKNGRPLCQNCKKEASVYDTSQTPRKKEKEQLLKTPSEFNQEKSNVFFSKCLKRYMEESFPLLGKSPPSKDMKQGLDISQKVLFLM